MAVGLVTFAFMTWVRVDLVGFLVGEFLAALKIDIAEIWGGSIVVLAVLGKIWKPLFAGTVNRELTIAEGVAFDQVNVVFSLF